ncbi:hypothetical protein TK90_2489 [Thioalkalivibrio sp. K90mix]|uniref:hypothetical protein n=1 Tax=unclassified Thioalkalivibrio TaxID=2621013 RepID=UPI0001C4E1FC|nr:MULTISPECIES: hypothetical protein [unclassified Thioalkalivibrio]ADC72979.1 hypothetical protein TK90_2489 [Thioalkalivibrio sp. K90mix]
MDNLYLKMTGNAFDQGYRLDKMIAGLSGTQQVLDGVYRGVTGKGRLSKKDREQYKLVAYEVQNKCLFVTLGAIFSGIQQILPLVHSNSPEAMWEYTRETVRFLYDIYKSAHSGEAIHIEQRDDNTTVVHKGDGNKTNVYHGPVQLMGAQIIVGLRSFDDALEEDNVSGIELGAKHEKEPAIRIPLEEKGLYYPPITIDKEPKTLHCDIFDFNKYEKEGRLSVSSGQNIAAGKYKFRVVGRQEVEEYILSMTETDVEVHCMVEYEHDPLKESSIGALLIMDVSA